MIEWIAAAVVVGAALFGGRDERKSQGPYTGGARQIGDWKTRRSEEQAVWRAKWEQELDRSRWIPQSFAYRILRDHPLPSNPSGRVFGDPVRSKTKELLAEFAKYNVEHLEKKKEELRDFFDNIEASPLTDEQREACICMDDAVQVVAAAGSGKTSTMIAKTGYVLREGLAKPEEVLLLAFNKKAAEELRQRVQDRLAGFPGVDKVTVSTFSAFGRKVIAQSEGVAPALARWVGSTAREQEKILQIVERLKGTDPSFKAKWELFRTVYARPAGAFSSMSQAREDGKGDIRTANGDWVKSEEERIIADWLFFHGVQYEYERDYEVDTRTPEHHQYRPDFYYPEIEVYHEHFALDRDGKVPPHFEGNYVASAEWKRECHAENGTELFETTSHGLRNENDIERLRDMLVDAGLQLEFDPDRPTKGQQPVTGRELANLFRAFQQHVKGNAVDLYAIERKLEDPKGLNTDKQRARKFLELYRQVAAAWEDDLRASSSIDFDDMLLRGAEALESGAYKSPYKMIFADEFQDSSRARIRLLKALLDQAEFEGHLCVVGDDWQSINRFAGADLSVMTEFAKTFPHSSQLRLATTFRCPQALCDISSAFVASNPRQLEKEVKSTNPRTGPSVVALAYETSEDCQDALQRHLTRLRRELLEGKIDGGKGGRASVLLLGRYRREEPAGIVNLRRENRDVLDVQFRTVHSAKGLEADCPPSAPMAQI